MEPRIKIVGVMRFSVLTPTYHVGTSENLDDIAKQLFGPERMNLRFHLFENLVLPSIIAQSDLDFELVVLTAESMPTAYLERLEAGVSACANAQLRLVGPDNHYQIIREAYEAFDLGGATHRVMFRLDDDDALDLNYIERLRRTALALLGVQPPEVPQVISFNRGFYIRFQEGENEVFDACERAPLSTGTSLLAPADYPRNPYRYNHRNLAQHYNTYSDITTPSFIRTIHGDNKSKPTQMGPTHTLRKRLLSRQLRTHFGVTLKELRAL